MSAKPLLMMTYSLIQKACLGEIVDTAVIRMLYISQ